TVDGKIVLGGVGVKTDGVVAYPGMGVYRYNADGTPDESFGQHGMVALTSPEFDAAAASDVIVQADGKILALSIPFVVRFNSDGTLDPTFAGGAGVHVTFGSSFDDASASAAAITPAGRLLVVGQESRTSLQATGPGMVQFILDDFVRVTRSGTLVVSGTDQPDVIRVFPKQNKLWVDVDGRKQ